MSTPKLHPWLRKILMEFLPQDQYVQLRRYNPGEHGSSADTTIGYVSVAQLIAATIAASPNHWKGKFTTEAALNAAFPTAETGDFAIVDLGASTPARHFIWDDEMGWIDTGELKIGTSSDELVEGTSNLFFTVSRVFESILSSLSLLTATPVANGDSLVVAIGKLQAQINQKQAALVSGTTIKTVCNKSLLGEGNVSIPYDIYLAASDEITPIIQGGGKTTFKVLRDIKLESISGFLTIPQAAGSDFTVDVMVNGVSILSTKLVFSNGSDVTQVTVGGGQFTMNTISAGSKVSIDVIQVGDGTAAGLKVGIKAEVS